MNTARRLPFWLLLAALIAVALVDFSTRAGGAFRTVQLLWTSPLRPLLAMPVVAALVALLVSRQRGASVDSSIATGFVTVVVTAVILWLVVIAIVLLFVRALSQGPAWQF
jgi:hypothetical protein